jgi:putative copper resistance protein D
MATPNRRTNREYRAGGCHHWFYVATVLFPVLVFLCAGTAIGQESQQEAHHEARVWLEFNHHVGGVVVLVLAGLTWLEVLGIGQTAAVRLAWPSCLILIGLYNVILSDRFAWPIGSSGLIEILSNPEILQHKVLAVMVLALGLIELLRRLGRVTHNTAWLYLFYGMAVLTASILMVHDLGAGPHTHSEGLTLTHVLMGLLALLALVLKALVDRGILIGKSTQLYPLSLVGLGLLLLLFTESSGMVR